MSHRRRDQLDKNLRALAAQFEATQAQDEEPIEQPIIPTSLKEVEEMVLRGERLASYRNWDPGPGPYGDEPSPPVQHTAEMFKTRTGWSFGKKRKVSASAGRLKISYS